MKRIEHVLQIVDESEQTIFLETEASNRYCAVLTGLEQRLFGGQSDLIENPIDDKL